MHRHDHAQRRVDVFELLTDDPEADVVHAGAAILLRHRTAEQAKLRHLRAGCSCRSGARDRARESCGATSRAPHSRTECSSRRCSSVRSKSIMNASFAKNEHTHSSSRLQVSFGDAARHCASQRLRDSGPLRRHDEGGHPRDLPGRDPRGHHSRHRAPRRPGRRAGTGGVATNSSPPARSFWPSWIPASAPSRRGIAAEIGDYRFVCPDNGLLSAPSSATMPPKKVVELTERRYARPTVSRTFEGRDRFAPAAAWIGQGHPADGDGTERSRLHQARHPASCRRGRRLRGAVLRLDRFGNLVTNIDRKTFEKFGKEGGVQIAAGGAHGRTAGRDLCRHPGGRGLRALRQHRPPRARGQLRQCRRGCSGSRAAPLIKITRIHS